AGGTRANSEQDLGDGAVANNVPVLPVTDQEDFEAEVKRVGSAGVLNVDLEAEHEGAVSANDLDIHNAEVIDLATWDHDAEAFQISDSWQKELAQNVGDLRPAAEVPSTTLVSDTDLAQFPVTTATA